MRKILNVSLYVIIFLLIATICILSIKKFFDMKKSINLGNIVVSNIVVNMVSFNKIESDPVVVSKLANEEQIDSFATQVVENNYVEEVKESEKNEVEVGEEKPLEDVTIEEVTETNDIILYDGYTEVDLINKLEKSLKNELSGTGVNFVQYYKNTGLDPYLAVAIVLHETGCSWTCSNLVKECYNYGGMKGGDNKYKETNYTCYSSKEDGINAYLNMLYSNYFSKGLTTAELINPKYASSLEWSVKINNYIEKIKSN